MVGCQLGAEPRFLHLSGQNLELCVIYFIYDSGIYGSLRTLRLIIIANRKPCMKTIGIIYVMGLGDLSWWKKLEIRALLYFYISLLVPTYKIIFSPLGFFKFKIFKMDWGKFESLK